MAFNPTSDQLKAITAKGNILVSAAAGSGKTAVLVERVIKKLCSKTDSVSADKLLIVTFTNAAAAEMRSRIEKRLDEECRNNPDDLSLLLQKHLLPSAKICTIDSFCIDLVRENFERLDISPDFKMSDNNSLKPINEKIAKDIVNRYLEENNTDFFELLDLIGAEYDDSKFIDFVLELYDYSRQLPNPQNWFRSFKEFYSENGFNCDSPWWKSAFSKALEAVKSARVSLAKAIDLVAVSEIATKNYLPVFRDTAEQYNALEEAVLSNEWDILFNKLVDFSALSLPSVRGVNSIPEITSAKDIYKYITTKPIEKLKKIFYADNTFINAQFLKISRLIDLLSNILIEFENLVFEEYKQNNTFTFHNTEHLALKLLCDEENSDILSRFEEVMVDEYQDTNDLQDMLFKIISNNEKNLFVVGDVKQSIYGFRGANPANFLSKKLRYIPIDETNSDNPQKIILGNNFRTKGTVCDFINFFFELFMNEETGDIVYNQEEKLFPAATFPETNKISTEYHIIESKENAAKTAVIEARHIADYIRKTMAEGEIIKLDDDNLRKPIFSDFAILLRSAKTKAPIIAEELKRQGIPANYSVEGFAECAEIATFLSLLSVIDNPETDIELLSLLISPIFAFTPEDLAKIRIEKRNGNLYQALVFNAKNGNEKCTDFLEKIEKFRIMSVTYSLPKLISKLLSATNYLNLVTVMNDGLRRRNNLLLLVEYAKTYSENNFASIGSFVKYVRKQSETGLGTASASTGGDSVKIMSIHASKGLQFPICIVAGVSADFNDFEARLSTLYSTELGVGFKYFDEEDKMPYTTIGREIILERAREIRLEEELRLLYVAATRTQDRLLFTATLSSVEKKAQELISWLLASNSKIDANLFSRTKSYNDWLMLALLLHKDGRALRPTGTSLLLKETNSEISLSIIDSNSVPDNSLVCDFEKEALPNKEIVSALKENFGFEYPYKELLGVESKASVSKLANSAESAKFAFSSKPSFMSKSGLTAAEKGTAMHKVMQFFDFSKANDIETVLSRLYEWQFITENEFEAIDRGKLKAFFESNLFKRIQNSNNVQREMRFLTEVEAKKIAPHLDEEQGNEKIIIQGAVDICFEEEDGIVILDFKTDRVTSLETLAETYGEQLNIYGFACEKIFEKEVKEKVIYSFNLSDEIKVK